MAGKKQTEQQEIDEELIDIGDEDEVEVDVSLDDANPNVADTLQAADQAEDHGEEPDEIESEDEEDKRSPEEKLKAFLDANPDVSDLRSKDIKGRIDKLTWEAKEAQRQLDAATEFARGVQRENVELKSKQQHQDGVFINEHKARLEAQVSTAKKQLKEALEAGDPELIADAQTLIARTTAELTQAEQTETRFERFVRSKPEEKFVPYEPPAPEGGPAPQPQVDPKAQAWAEKNAWFGEDEDMTQAALNIHQKLVMEEGYIPTGNGYYAELDARMRRNFPDKFETPRATAMQGEQMVTAPSRTASNRNPRGKRNVRLTPSQVAIAKKLGVPLEEYAKYVPQ